MQERLLLLCLAAGRVRGRHRVRLLVKADKGVALQPALAEWVSQFRLPSNLRMAIDIDPQSFY